MNYPYGRNLLLSTVGFERLIDAFEQINTGEGSGKTQSYPPYNILKFSDQEYAIEIAVAGFSPDELDINAEGIKLSVIGKTNSERKGEFLHRGIATRDFSHQFTLAETVVIRAANIDNGLLVIKLENVIPAEKLARKIPIGAQTNLTIEDRLAA